MDPLALSGAFATVVGLLVNYKAERSSSELSEFMSWLREQHQDEMAQAIARNSALSTELSSLLSTKHEVLVDRLAHLNEQMSFVASRIEGFAGLVQTLGPALPLSEQAKSVLKQLVQSGASLFMERRLSTGKPPEYVLMGGATGAIKYTEPQFMNEDLETLVASNLLRLELAGKGTRKFIATRSGVTLVRASDG